MAKVQLRIFTEPQQGATYDDLARVAVAAEDLGFDAFFRSDHYLAMNAPGDPGPTDAWLTLAGVGPATPRLQPGAPVTPPPVRYPGPLAIGVAQVDQMSGGRVELGLGAGWFAAEHAAYGIPFPPLGERFDRLEEQLSIITGLWATPAGDRFAFDGAHYTLSDSPALPKPVQGMPGHPSSMSAAAPHPGPPIIIGGQGRVRTPALAARFAAEFNVVFEQPDVAETRVARVRQACERIGRDPSGLVYSAALVLCTGRTDAELSARADAIGREVDELRLNGAAGTPAEVVEKIERYRAAWISRIYLQVLDLSDLDHLALVADKVAPHLASM